MADENKDKKAAGSGGFLVALILMIVVGLGSGAALEMAMPTQKSAAAPKAAHPAPAAKGDKAAHGTEAETAPPANAEALAVQVVPIEPILINLAGPNRSMARIEGAVAFGGPPEKDRSAIMADIGEDIAGFMRGTSVAQLEAAVGLELLREDLSEVVRLRTKGKARRFILKTLVLE